MTKLIYEPSKTTHWKNLFPNKMQLLGSQNLNPGEELIATIKSVGKQVVKGRGGKEDEVAVIHFDKAAPMVLNITNSRTISGLYGPYYEGWSGKPIQIYATEVSVSGKSMLGLRVRAAIPSVETDISVYETSLRESETIEDLQIAFGEIPRHIRPRLTAVKDEMKANLAEISNDS